MTIRNLDKVLRPQSVALIGASGREGSLGHHLMRNLTADFKGPVMLVNPGHDEIQGRRCWRDVTALPSAPDLAVIATPAAAVPKVIADLGALGTRGAVVITAGLTRENGLRQAMLDAARPNLFRVIGPNCLGIAVPGARLNASFAHLAPAPGKLAFLSQSGALVGAVLDWAAGHDIGFSHVIAMGDMADVDVGDLLDYLAGDPETSAILLYLETVTNPRKFLAAARSALRAKPVVAVKSGRHAAAAQAASTHTGALTVSDSVANAAFRRAGILRVEGLQDLFIAAEALARTTPLKGDRLAILTNGGGAGVLAVDKLMDLGGTLARLDAGTIDALGQQVPATWSHANPVDIIGDAGGERYTATLEILLDASDNDAVLVMSCPTALASAEAMAAAVVDTVERRRASRRPVKPVLTNWLGEPGVKAARARFAAAGIPTYDTPAAAVQSFADLVGYRKAQQALMRTPPLLPRDFSVDRDAVRSAIETVAAEGRALLTEPEAKAVLAAYGIDTVPTEVAATPVDAGRAAGRLLAGGTTSIALKILSRDISHKSDVGGVVLAIASPQEAEAAAAAMLQRVAASP